MTTFALDIRKAPLMAAVFFMVLFLVVASIAERLGWFEPGPPLEIEEIVASIEGNRVLYIVEGTKLTDRNLVAQTASWIFSDDSSMPVAIERPSGAIFASEGQRRVEGDHFVSSMLAVAIPEAALSDAGVQLRWCWAYENTPTFCVDRPLAEIAGG